MVASEQLLSGIFRLGSRPATLQEAILVFTTRVSTKFSSVVILLLATVLLAAACGSDPTATPRPAPTATAVPEPTATPLPPGVPTPTPVPPTATPAPTPTPSFDAAAHFKGKTVRILVGWDPATSSDLQARYLARTLSDYIPGNPRMIVTNMPGASAIIASNYMAAAKPDGLTLFYGVGGQPTNQIQRADESKYEFDKFVRVGTFENRPAVWYIAGDAPYDRIQDAVGGTKEFTYGTETFNAPVALMTEALNLPVRQVLGISGSTTGFLLAFDRGDVDSMISGSGWYRISRDRPGWFKDHFIEPFGKTADPSTVLQPNTEISVPSDLVDVRTLMSDEHVKDFNILTATDGSLYRNSFLPPNTPPEIQQVFVTALQTAFENESFIEGLTTIMGRSPDALMTGQELDAFTQSFSVADLDAAYKKWDPTYVSPLN